LGLILYIVAMNEDDKFFGIIFGINTFYCLAPMESLGIKYLVEKCYFYKIFEEENLKIYQVIKRING